MTGSDHHAIGSLMSTWPVAGNDRRGIFVATIATPLGEMLAIVDNEKLHMLEFCDLENLANKIKKLQQTIRVGLRCGRNAILTQVEAELGAYFTGKSAGFSVRCALHGADFSRQVWQALQRIPVATTCSYGEQARALGRANAYRAVARANSQNKIAIIIPCHRVIGANGQLTGYAGGLERKRWLLAHEQQYFATS